MDESEQIAIELALAQAKKLQRESRILVQQLARLRDGDLQDQEDVGI